MTSEAQTGSAQAALGKPELRGRAGRTAVHRLPERG
jgi:hypothetical protein